MFCKHVSFYDILLHALSLSCFKRNVEGCSLPEIDRTMIRFLQKGET